MKTIWSFISWLAIILIVAFAVQIGQNGTKESFSKFFKHRNENAIEDELNQLVSAIRNGGPRMIDDITRFDGATSLGERKLRYDYQLIGSKGEKSIFELLDENNIASIKKDTCNGTEKSLLSKGVTIIYKYTIERNPSVQTEIVVTPETCTQLANQKSLSTNPVQNFNITKNNDLTDKDIFAPVNYKQIAGHDPVWSPIDLGKSNQLYYDARSVERISDTTFTIYYIDNEAMPGMSDRVHSMIFSATINCKGQSIKPGNIMLFAMEGGIGFIEEIKIKSDTPFRPIERGGPPAFIQSKLCNGPIAK